MVIILQWLQIAQTQAAEIPGLDSLWRLKVKAAKARQARAWQAVRGPMGAVIVTLLDAGWEPEEWCRWVDCQGNTWELADIEDTVCNMKTCDSMLRAFRRDMLQQVWLQVPCKIFLAAKLLGPMVGEGSGYNSRGHSSTMRPIC